MINQTKQYDVLNIPCTIEDHKYPYNLPKRRYKVCHFALGRPVQGISSLTVISNLSLSEEKTDFSDILWQLFSSKLKHIFISKLLFAKK